MSVSLLLAASASAFAALPLGVGWTGDYTQAANEMEVVGKSGSTYFRLPVNPKRSSNGSDWSYYDSVFANAATNGVTILPVLEGKMGAETGYPSASEGLQWEAWVKQAIRRYGYKGLFWSERPWIPARPVTAWEMGNEPNLKINSGVDAKEYGEFLNWAGPIVQGTSQSWGEHSTGVLFGGLLDFNREKNYVNFFKTAVGYTNSGTFTGLAFHPYPLDPGFFSGTRIQAFKDAVTEARQTLTAATDASKTLWVTEAGWPAELQYEVGTDGQATLLTEAVDWSKSQAEGLNLKALLWYNQRDISVNSWQYRCGLRDGYGGYRPAWYAFQREAGVSIWPPEPPIPGEDDDLPGPHSVVQPNGSIDSFFRTPSGSLGHSWTQGGPWSEQDVSGTSVAVQSVPHPIIKANGQIDVFWRTPSGGLGHAWNDSGGWHADTLPGSLSSDPHPVMQANGTIDVLFRTTSGGLGHDWYQPGGAWNGNVLPGSVASAPYSVAQNKGWIDTFFRTPSGGLGHAWTQGGSWSEQDLSFASVAASSVPHPVVKPNGQVDVFWRTPTDGLGHAWDDAGGWHVETLAGSLGSDPHPVLANNGTIDVFYRTSTGGLGHNWYQPGNQWFSGMVPGSLASDPYPVIKANGQIDVFWQTPNSETGHAWDDAGGWHADTVGGTPASVPHAVAQSTGTIDVLFRTTSGGLGHDWYQAGGQWQSNTITGSVAARPPIATTGAASSVGSSSATLEGVLNPEGSATAAYFEYGPTTAYGSKTPPEQLGSGLTNIGFSKAVTGLAPATTYHFRVVTTGPGGTAAGTDGTFKTK